MFLNSHFHFMMVCHFLIFCKALYQTMPKAVLSAPPELPTLQLSASMSRVTIQSPRPCDVTLFSKTKKVGIKRGPPPKVTALPPPPPDLVALSTADLNLGESFIESESMSDAESLSSLSFGNDSNKSRVKRARRKGRRISTESSSSKLANDAFIAISGQNAKKRADAILLALRRYRLPKGAIVEGPSQGTRDASDEAVFLLQLADNSGEAIKHGKEHRVNSFYNRDAGDDALPMGEPKKSSKRDKNLQRRMTELVIRVTLFQPTLFYRSQIRLHNNVAPLAPDLPYPEATEELTSSHKGMIISDFLSLIAAKSADIKDSEVFVSATHDLPLRKRVWRLGKQWFYLLKRERKSNSNLWHIDEKLLFEYFGADTMHYFAYMNHFHRWLGLSSVIAIALLVSNYVLGLTNESNPLVPFFSIFTMFSAILFVKFWERKVEYLAVDFSLNIDETSRAPYRRGFYGETRPSPITGEKEIYYPGWKRGLKQVVSWTASIIFLLVGLFIQLCSINLQGYMNTMAQPALEIDFFDDFSDEGALFDANGPYAMVPVVLHVIVVLILNLTYKLMAEALTEWENYRTLADANASLTQKRVGFEFVNNFCFLFYIAFYRFDLPMLTAELQSLFWMDQLRRLAMESVVPYLQIYSADAWAKVWRKIKQLFGWVKRKLSNPLHKWSGKPKQVLTTSPKKSNTHPSFRHQASGPQAQGSPQLIPTTTNCDSLLIEADNFDDYLEMTMQFGYVTLFASAFPLASVFALFCGLVEIRSDLFKKCFIQRRTIDRSSQHIHLWTGVLKTFAFMSVVTNTLLFTFTSGHTRKIIAWWQSDAMLDPETSDDEKLTVTVAFIAEHAFLLLAYFLYWRIRSVPKKVEEEKMRRRYNRVKAKVQQLNRAAATK